MKFSWRILWGHSMPCLHLNTDHLERSAFQCLFLVWNGSNNDLAKMAAASPFANFANGIMAIDLSSAHDILGDHHITSMVNTLSSISPLTSVFLSVSAVEFRGFVLAYLAIKSVLTSACSAALSRMSTAAAVILTARRTHASQLRHSATSAGLAASRL